MGIYLRKKTYWARWTEDGKQRRESLETGDLTEAQRRYRELTGRAVTEQPKPARTGKPSAPTVRQILSGWFQCKRQLNPVFPSADLGAILLVEEGCAGWERSARLA